MTESEDPKAQERQRVILEHLRGRLSATEAALSLGMSRKTFYEWLDRALGGMRSALRDRPTGRPPHPADPEKEHLLQEVEILEKERLVLENRLRIQEAVRQTLNEMRGEASPPKKNEGRWTK